MTNRRTTTTIQSGAVWWRIDWAEVWDYRDLLWLLVRRDFVARYKQTVLGPAWAVIQPVVTALVFSVLFGQIVGISTEGVPHLLFYMTGLLMWNLFTTVFNGCGNVLQGNAALFGKVYFPRLVVPLSLAIAALIPFAIQLLILAGFIAIYGGPLTGWTAWILLPIHVIHCCLLAFGCGLWLSSLTAKYRDLQHALAFIIQIWMYGTPIIYPLSTLPERWQPIVALNPVTAIVEGARSALLGVGSWSPALAMMSWLLTLCIAGTGLLLFRRTERTFIDAV